MHMKLRELEPTDMRGLSEFIIDVYHDQPAATWFEKEPEAADIERIFYNKIRGIGARELVDVVIDDNGTIAGECEVAKIGFDRGVIGVMVRHGYRRKRMGSDLMRLAMDSAVEIGITRFVAEVDEGNPDALKFFIRHSFMPVGYRDVERQGAPRRIVVLQHAIA